MTIRPIMVLVLLTSATVAAETGPLYRWVDADGVTHFSQWPPEDPAQEATAFKVASRNAPDYDPREDPNSVLNQAERIHASWNEMQERREERRPAAESVATHGPRRRPGIRWERWIHYPAYPPTGHFHRPVATARLRQRQLAALDELGHLEGPRPHSINSSLHRARVEASRGIPFRRAPPQR